MLHADITMSTRYIIDFPQFRGTVEPVARFCVILTRSVLVAYTNHPSRLCRLSLHRTRETEPARCYTSLRHANNTTLIRVVPRGIECYLPNMAIAREAGRDLESYRAVYYAVPVSSGRVTARARCAITPPSQYDG